MPGAQETLDSSCPGSPMMQGLALGRHWGAKGGLGGWEMAVKGQVGQLLETAWPCLPHPPPHWRTGPAGTCRALLGVPGGPGIAGWRGGR